MIREIGGRRTRAGDQETVVLGTVGGICHVVDDVVGVEGKSDVCHQSETAAILLQKSPTRGDP